MKKMMILGAMLLGGMMLATGCGSCKEGVEYSDALAAYSTAAANPETSCDQLKSLFSTVDTEFNDLCDDQKTANQAGHNGIVEMHELRLTQKGC